MVIVARNKELLLATVMTEVMAEAKTQEERRPRRIAIRVHDIMDAMEREGMRRRQDIAASNQAGAAAAAAALAEEGIRPAPGNIVIDEVSAFTAEQRDHLARRLRQHFNDSPSSQAGAVASGLRGGPSDPLVDRARAAAAGAHVVDVETTLASLVAHAPALPQDIRAVVMALASIKEIISRRPALSKPTIVENVQYAVEVAKTYHGQICELGNAIDRAAQTLRAALLDKEGLLPGRAIQLTREALQHLASVDPTPKV